MTATYQRKPVKVEALQWSGDNAAGMHQFAGHNFDVLSDLARQNCDDPTATAEVMDATNSTWKLLLIGDWVIRRDGEFYRHRAAEFARDYEEAR